MNACFITINSSEEKEVFKEALSTGINKDKFNFIELVPALSTPNWFSQACSQKTTCDILIVSGHFAGAFFGKSGARLESSELETHACKNDCSSILSSPKEVFLFGCSTLDPNGINNRSPLSNLSTILRDYAPIGAISNLIDEHYGFLGSSFKDSMKRSFIDVPLVYGFSNIGPSGKTIKKMLVDYHKKIPDYYEHLVTVEISRSLALMDKFYRWNQDNKILAKSLRTTYFTQTQGLVNPCNLLKNISKNDPIYERYHNICRLKSQKLSLEETAEHVKTLLSDKNFSVYLPAILDELNAREGLSSAVVAALDKNFMLKYKIRKLFENTKNNFSKLKVAEIAYQLNIIKKEELKSTEKKVILTFLTSPMTLTAKDAICSYRNLESIEIKKQEIPPDVFNDPNGIQALNCLKLNF